MKGGVPGGPPSGAGLFVFLCGNPEGGWGWREDNSYVSACLGLPRAFVGALICLNGSEGGLKKKTMGLSSVQAQLPETITCACVMTSGYTFIQVGFIRGA